MAISVSSGTILHTATHPSLRSQTALSSRLHSSFTCLQLTLATLPFAKCVEQPRRLARSFSIPTVVSRIVTQDGNALDEGLCSMSKGLFDSVVGVLGGGQLGRMLCQAASPMGIKVAVLDPVADCPASNIAFEHTVGSFRDTDAVREFGKRCSVLTVEIEHVDVETLEALAAEGTDVEPKPSTIRIIQDKYLQKVHFKENGVELPDFMKVDDEEGAEEAGRLFGYPLMLKSRKLAYDGRGNAVVYSEDGISKAVSLLGGYGRGLYAEKWAPFVKELAVMVARGRDGSIRSFPLVETTHKESICFTVEAPARVSRSISKGALATAEKAVESLQGAGIFGVELFLLADGQVLLNEVAPRPHNSGHYTIEACYVSQYEQHLRAVLGLPLGDPSMKVPAALMYNILGEDEGEAGFSISRQILQRAVATSGASVHWYEKAESQRQRKMGHLTLVGSRASVLRKRLNTIIDSGSQNKNVQADSQSDVETLSDDAPLVRIIMGSDSDLPVMKDAAKILEQFDVPYKLTIVSAHRTPDRLVSFAKAAHEQGTKVIIAGAGGAAHLPGMVAALSPLVVIGVPVKGSSTEGLDSLLSIVQMPGGVPVATMAIQNATNAGLTAVRALGIANPELMDRMEKYQEGLKDMVMEKAERLEKIGWKEYLDKKGT